MQSNDTRLLIAVVIAIVGFLTIGYTIERAGYWPRALTTDNGEDCPPLPEASARRDYDQAIRIYTEALANTCFSTQDAICLLRDRAHTKEWSSDIASDIAGELHMDVEAAKDDETAKVLEKKFWDLVARTGAKLPNRNDLLRE